MCSRMIDLFSAAPLDSDLFQHATKTTLRGRRNCARSCQLLAACVHYLSSMWLGGRYRLRTRIAYSRIHFAQRILRTDCLLFHDLPQWLHQQAFWFLCSSAPLLSQKKLAIQRITTLLHPSRSRTIHSWDYMIIWSHLIYWIMLICTQSSLQPWILAWRILGRYYPNFLVASARKSYLDMA